jgi:hypothetical protein
VAPQQREGVRRTDGLNPPKTLNKMLTNMDLDLKFNNNGTTKGQEAGGRK